MDGVDDLGEVIGIWMCKDVEGLGKQGCIYLDDRLASSTTFTIYTT